MSAPQKSPFFMPELWSAAIAARLQSNTILGDMFTGSAWARPHGHLWMPRTELDHEVDALLTLAGMVALPEHPDRSHMNSHWQVKLRSNKLTYQTPPQLYNTLEDWKRSIGTLLDMANGKLDGY